MADVISKRSIVYDITFNTGTAKKGATDIGTAMKGAEKEIDKATASVNTFAAKTLNAGQRLKQIKNELNNFKGTEAQFQKLSLEAAKLSDQIQNTNRRISNLASSTRHIEAFASAFQGLTGVFTAVQGAQALFGKETENVQKALVRLNASLALLQGVQAAVATVTEESKAKTLAITAAQKAYAFVVGTSTGALKGFRIALAATGIGLAVIAVAALVQNWDKLTGSISEADKKLQHLRETQLNAIAATSKNRQSILEAEGKQIFDERDKQLQAELTQLTQARLRIERVEKANSQAVIDAKQAVADKRVEIELNVINREKFIREQGLKNIIALREAQASIEEIGSEMRLEAEIRVLEAQKNLELRSAQDSAIKRTAIELAFIENVKKLRKDFAEKQNQLDLQRTQRGNELTFLNETLDKENDLLAINTAENEKIWNDYFLELDKLFTDQSLTLQDRDQLFDLITARTNKDLSKNLNDRANILAQSRQSEIDAETAHQQALLKLRQTNASGVSDQSRQFAKEALDIESERLQKQAMEETQRYADGLTSYEDYANRVIAIQDSIAQNDAERGAINRDIAKSVRDAQIQYAEEALNALISLSKDGSKAQIALAGVAIFANQAKAIAAAIASAAEASVSAGGLSLPVLIPAFVSIALSTFAQVNGLLAQAKAAQSNVEAFAEGEVDIHRPGEKRGKDSIPAVIMPGESVIKTERTKQYKPELMAIQDGRLEDLIHVNYVEPALALKALDNSKIDSTQVDYSDKFYRQYLATGEGNLTNKRAVKVLMSIDRKLSDNKKRYH